MDLEVLSHYEEVKIVNFLDRVESTAEKLPAMYAVSYLLERLNKAGKVFKVVYYKGVAAIGPTKGAISLVFWENTSDAAGVKQNAYVNAKKLETESVFLSQQTGAFVTVYANRHKMYSELKNASDNEVDIIIEVYPNLASKVVPYVVSLLPRLFPVLYENNPPKKEEMDVLKELAKGNLTALMRKFNSLDIDPDVEKRSLIKMLKNFSNTSLEKKLADVVADYTKTQQDLDALMRRISSLVERLEDLGTQRDCVAKKIESGAENDSELLDYLLNVPQIKLIKREEDKLYFHVFAELDNIDELLYEKYIENQDGHTSITRVAGYSKEQMRRFFRACWSERSLKIRVWAAYYVESNGNLKACGDVFPYHGDGYVSSPHVVLYNCFGSFSNRVASAIAKQDPIMSLNTAIGLTKNLNLSDGVVTSSFATELKTKGYTCKFVEDTDGNLMTLDEAIRMLDKKAEGCD